MTAASRPSFRQWGPRSVDRLYRSRADRIIMVSLLTAMGLLWILPIFSAIDRALVFNGWGNFWAVITGDIGGITLQQTYWNSFVIAFLHAAIVVSVSSLAGYGFANFQFPGKEIMYYTTLVFLAVPATSILVPLFYIARELNLRDAFLGVALPEASLTLPFGVLLMRNFAETIPETYIEAASMDGASHLRIFGGVFLPDQPACGAEPREPVGDVVASGLPVPRPPVQRRRQDHRRAGGPALQGIPVGHARRHRNVQRQPRPAGGSGADSGDIGSCDSSSAASRPED